MEVLAPAGNREALERADAAGADAVYLGYTAFSARAGAGNFSREELAEAVCYAHLRGMRVHVTVNTLIKDSELREALDVLRMLRDIGADAVLIQDAGLLRLARACCPGLAVHASTQMTIHNRTGVRWCVRQGISRVVLARECSLEEIGKCAGQGAEIEVFGHGAMCVCVSGQCLFSSMAGERSGNRGRCAQPCRKPYYYRGKKGSWLSPRDICLRGDLPALDRAGAVSVKLEGRLKRPEYVAVTSESYVRGARSLEQGDFIPPDREETDALRQIFNRGGFTRGYAFGCRDAGIIDPEQTGHRGIEIGTVGRVNGGMAFINVSRDLNDGDGLTLRRGAWSADLIYSGPDTPAGGRAMLRLRDDVDAKSGDRVFRLTDSRQMKSAAELPGRRIKADMVLRAVPGEPLELTVTDGENTVRAAGETVQAARTRETAARELQRSLAKTGGTVFEAGSISTETAGAFVPVSELNGIRRRALSELEEKRISTFTPDNGGEGEYPADMLAGGKIPPTACVRNPVQARAARERGFRVVFYPEDWREQALDDLLNSMEPGDWLRLPEVCTEDTLNMIKRLTEKHADRLGGVMLGSIGQLGADWKVPFGAGPGIPVMNRQAAMLLTEQGCGFVTASPELTGSELRTLLEGDPPIAVQTYGRTQLMLLSHCPARTYMGLDRGHEACGLCDSSSPDSLRGTCLEAAGGYRYPLLRIRLPEGCMVRLMNTLPTELNGRREIRCRMIELTTENAEESERALDAAITGMKSGMPATAGHWSRPVD